MIGTTKSTLEVYAQTVCEEYLQWVLSQHVTEDTLVMLIRNNHSDKLVIVPPALLTTKRKRKPRGKSTTGEGEDEDPTYIELLRIEESARNARANADVETMNTCINDTIRLLHGERAKQRDAQSLHAKKLASVTKAKNALQDKVDEQDDQLKKIKTELKTLKNTAKKATNKETKQRSPTHMTQEQRTPCDLQSVFAQASAEHRIHRGH